MYWFYKCYELECHSSHSKSRLKKRLKWIRWTSTTSCLSWESVTKVVTLSPSLSGALWGCEWCPWCWFPWGLIGAANFVVSEIHFLSSDQWWPQTFSLVGLFLGQMTSWSSQGCYVIKPFFGCVGNDFKNKPNGIRAKKHFCNTLIWLVKPGRTAEFVVHFNLNNLFSKTLRLNTNLNFYLEKWVLR